MVDSSGIGRYQVDIGSADAWVVNYLADYSTKDSEPMTGDDNDDTNINDDSNILYVFQMVLCQVILICMTLSWLLHTQGIPKEYILSITKKFG